MPILEKIYIQAPKDSVDSIEYKIKALIRTSHIDIEKITSKEEFYVPFEYI